MKNIKKTVIVAVLIGALTIGSASALTFEAGVGGHGGYEGYVAGKFWGAADVSGYGYGYGGAYAYTNIGFGAFELGVDVGYQSKFTGILFAGVSGAYDFTLAPGLFIYPKVGVDFSFLFDIGLDILAGVGVSYNFRQLLGLGLVLRAEVLFDAYIGFGGLLFSGGAVSLGPQFRVAAGYKF
jgi:hypothetical protein